MGSREAKKPDPGSRTFFSRGKMLGVSSGLFALAAAGLASCTLLYLSTRRLGWSVFLATTLLLALAIPLGVLRRACRDSREGGHLLFLGILYLSCGLWTAVWSFLPDLEYYLRDALLAASALFLLLGTLLLFLPLLLPRKREGKRDGEQEDPVQRLSPGESGPP